MYSFRLYYVFTIRTNKSLFTNIRAIEMNCDYIIAYSSEKYKIFSSKELCFWTKFFVISGISNRPEKFFLSGLCLLFSTEMGLLCRFIVLIDIFLRIAALGVIAKL